MRGGRGGGGGGGNRRRQTESFNPAVPDHRQFASNRDSDASFASSRPSPMGRPSSVATDPYTDRSYQSKVISSINNFLSTHSSPITLRAHPVPSVKDISETLKFLLTSIEYDHTPQTWEDDTCTALKYLHCPFKFTKSLLRAPNTPHNWPTALAGIHWLVQFSLYSEHDYNNYPDIIQRDDMNAYTIKSYTHYIHGEDELVEKLDNEFLGKMDKEKEKVEEKINVLKRTVEELMAKTEALKTAPTLRQNLEKEKNVLEDDVNKFHAMIGDITGRIEATENLVNEKEKEFKTKEEETKRIQEENDELKKKVELQSINARDAERMKRELQVVDREIGEVQQATDSYDQKSWELDITIRNQFSQLETLKMECNQALKRLKSVGDFQYNLNEKGSTPEEIMGVDYKAIVKPALTLFAEELKKSSIEKMEELIALQHHSSQTCTSIETKKKHIAALQSTIAEMEEKLKSVRMEIEDYTDKCAAEAKEMMNNVQNEAHKLSTVEKEAAEAIKLSELKKEEATKECEEEIKVAASELFTLGESILKHKECIKSKIAQMKSELDATVEAVSDTYKQSVPALFDANRET